MIRTVGYFVGPAGLLPGHVRQPGRWGDIIREHGQRHEHFSREALLERVRTESYSQKPSRLEANFLCFRIEDAAWDREKFHPDDVIYDVLFDSEACAFHQGQILCIPPLVNFSDVEAAHHYWKADHAVSEIGGSSLTPWEVVTLSPIKVVGLRPDGEGGA